jgi:hypothetical protein
MLFRPVILSLNLPHTIRFPECVQPLIDHPLEVTRAELIV